MGVMHFLPGAIMCVISALFEEPFPLLLFYIPLIGSPAVRSVPVSHPSAHGQCSLDVRSICFPTFQFHYIEINLSYSMNAFTRK